MVFMRVTGRCVRLPVISMVRLTWDLGVPWATPVTGSQIGSESFFRLDKCVLR